MEAERKEELRAILARNAMAQDWVRFYIAKMRKQLKALKIHDTGTLARSFEREFKYRGGSISEITIRFLQYGRFVDMGVGRGLRAYERDMNTVMQKGVRAGAKVTYVKRRPRRWFNKINTAQIWKLRELLERDLGHASVRNIRGAIVQQTEYRIDI